MSIAAIALDLGSTSIKAGLLDDAGSLSAVVAHPVPPMNISGERYESDALAYAETADAVLAESLAQISGLAKTPGLVHTPVLPPLGMCSQRSSFLLWDKLSGKPVTPLISWQDTRGAASCVALEKHEAEISRLSGLRLTPYFFAPKLRVLLLEHPAWRGKLLRGEWLLGTLDTFLIWRWTEGRHHLTDVSMAARTLLLDIHAEQWSPELCALFDIPQAILPQIHASAGLDIPLQNGLTLQASVADQSAALYASVGRRSDIALVNLGTGGFVIRHLEQDHTGPAGYLRTLVYRNVQHPARIAIEGTLNSIAAALAPYPATACKPEQLGQIPDLYCLAEPSGIGAPFFRKDIGLVFSAPVDHLSPAEIAALLLEAIIFRVALIIEEFHREAPLAQVYLSGGLSELPCVQDGLAQCLPCPLFRLAQHDASLQGAALLAAAIEVRCNRQQASIARASNIALLEKYALWKKWLGKLISR